MLQFKWLGVTEVFCILLLPSLVIYCCIFAFPTGRPADRLARTPSTPSSSSKGVGEANVPSPFSPNVHGNPAFNPQKMGTGKGGVSKVT